MDIIVVVKETFDPEEKIAIRGGRVQEDGVAFIMNPYDEFAVEEAIRLKEKHGGTVTVITAGPGRAEQVLRTALAMGADQAAIVEDEFADADEMTISKVLAAAIRKYPYDVILAGNMSIDHGSSQVGPRLAELLGIAEVSAVTRLEIDGSVASVERDVEGDVERMEIPLPLLATAQQGLNQPRYPSLPGIMKAKKKPVERWTSAELGLAAGDLQAKTASVERYAPPKKQAGRMLSGELDAQVKQLVHLLHQEDKVV